MQRLLVDTDGKEGLPPHIPPDASLTFDLTLLGYRVRTPWVKPLIQDQSTHEKPYHTDLNIYMEMIRAAGIGTKSVEYEDGDEDSTTLGGMRGNKSPSKSSKLLMNSPGGSRTSK
jgi:hypothetical protein